MLTHKRGHIQYTFQGKEEYELMRIESELLDIDDSITVTRTAPNNESSLPRSLFKISFNKNSDKEVNDLTKTVKNKLIELSGSGQNVN